MAVYMIGYDLMAPDKDYTELIDAIKDVGTTWCHPLDSTWFVKSLTKSTQEIRDELLPHIDSNDKLLVSKQSTVAAWRGLSKPASDWLKKHIPEG